MKKIICGIVLSLGLVGNASAFDIQSNDDVMKQVLIQSVLQQLLGGQSNLNKQINVTIGSPQNIYNGIGVTQCWTKFVYHSNGTKTPKVVCM